MEEKKSLEVIKIEEEMQGAYLEYAMSVIAGRALPDVRDGLKPVHRRILFAMNELNNTWDRRYLKSARIVGDVIGKYHPHGDSAVYNAMVRMAQPFSQRYVLVDGQGNFGSIDGDNAAAMRYTESRMSRLGGSLLLDIEKDTVDFGPNYDGSMHEPKVLPTRVPNLLINGSGGIAVGMSTNIPPHNFSEVVRGTIALIDNPAITVEELMEFIPGPDFPTAGVISNRSGIRSMYRTGRGSFTIKGRAEIESVGKDKEAIIVTELPYQVNKSTWIETVANLVREKQIEGIVDLRDESDRTGIRVVIELRRGESSQIILNSLYAKTQLQTSFGTIMLAIDNGRPRLFDLKGMLLSFLDHRRDVVTRRCVFDLHKAQAREHILEGLKIALDNIDGVVEIIKRSPGPVEAKSGLQEAYRFTEKQSQAILEMRLQRLTGLEVKKLLEELEEIRKEVAYLQKVLSNDKELFLVIKTELEEVLELFGDKRLSEISTIDDKDFDVEDFVKDEDVIVTISNAGFVKRNSLETYRSQGRGGRGIRGAGIGEVDGDFVKDLFIASTHSYLLCFTNLGRLHWLKVHRIPEMQRTARGRPLIQVLQLNPNEKVLSVLPVREFEEGKFVFMATKAGVVKKTELMAFSNVRTAGIIAIQFDDGDALVGAAITTGKDDVFMATKQGQSIRFSEDDVRAMGRAARGVRGMSLAEGDEVVAMEILPSDDITADFTLLSVTSLGYGKRTSLSEYRRQGRSGSGIINLKTTDKVGFVVDVKKVRPNDDVIVISDKGQLIRTPAAPISEIGRNTQGVRIISLNDSEKVQAVAIVREVIVEGESQAVH
jgi:DNA gyrase subunit A